MFKSNPEKAKKIMDKWLAVDIYPEYQLNAIELLRFIERINIRRSNILMNNLRDKNNSNNK
jgi:hypothetical protein